VFTPNPGLNGYPEAVKAEAVAMYLDGQGFRRIGRNLKVNHQSVANWVKAAAEKAMQKPLPLPEPDEARVAELDELFTFVKDKKTKHTSSRTLTGKRAVS
jgi:transposase-like protein